MNVIIDNAQSHDSFTSNHESHFIAATGAAYSNDSKPALTTADFTDLTLVNFGVITNTSGNGLLFTAHSTGIIYNEDGAFISGHKGVVLNGGDVTLNNNGTIVGSGTPGNCAVYIGATSTGDQINNTGSIIGQDKGIQINNSNDSIINYGFIGGGNIGIEYSMPAHLHDAIDNFGTIKGGTAAITANRGALTLHNHGTVMGNILLESTSPLDGDVIVNDGKIVGLVKLGMGDDTFKGGNGRSGAVFGEGGNDKLVGSSHADVLIGGAGNDTLIGGPGEDWFVFNMADAASCDHITDFTPRGVDQITLSNGAFGGIAPGHALLASMFHIGPDFSAPSQRIDYIPASGWLVYDSNGSAAGGQHIHFATLAPHLPMHNTDFLMDP